MENNNEDIEKELESKSIERDELQIKEIIEDKPVIKRTKKTRSAAQIAAFERAKEKRAANIALKKKQKEEEKTIIKEEKEIMKEKVKELTKELKEPKTESKEKSAAQQEEEKKIIREIPQVYNPRDQVVNNHYYYYGVPPPQHYTEPIEKKSNKSKKPKKPRPPTPSSSSEEEEEYYPIAKEPAEEPELYKELQNFKEEEPQPIIQKTTNPPLKFRFA